ncbi:MAG TPA: hypothetical protein VGO11_15130 [Chthoniobacteraceae bacterium]|jgi:hypothetical protein|nr:hypothetical protein [Chthoniobacteraceae bacterium]
MISGATGEIVLANGVIFTPHCGLVQEHLVDVRAHRELSVPGWTLHLLGEHESDHGLFEVQAVSDPACRICTVLLSHLHPFYGEEADDEAERRAFHEGVLETDLGGLREFFWGEVFCRTDTESNQDWLVVVYRPGPTVPLRPPIPPRYLRTHAPLPELSPPEPADNFSLLNLTKRS